MLAKRILSLVLGFAVTAIIIIFTNYLVVNAVITLFIIIGINELDKAFSQKQIKPISSIPYIFAGVIFVINTLIFLGYIKSIHFEIICLYIVLPLMFLILFIVYVLKHHKYTILDVGITVLQMVYVVFLFNFITNIYSLNNGQVYIWYIFIASWSTDIFAYCVGKLIGKHHFTSISPKKTIEGSIGGILGAIICMLGFTYFFNIKFNLSINYMQMSIIAVICSIIAQVGDLFASSIKRYTGIKDFGKVLPGHGGIIDRFDSTIFVSPVIFAYFYLFF